VGGGCCVKRGDSDFANVGGAADADGPTVKPFVHFGQRTR
jgi:hypothetical protein